ncbi:MAG: hypothetical protein ACKVU4_07215 [Phycisphaerales bacterium]
MLTGYVLKFYRAIHHLDDLRTQTAAWFNSDRCTIIREPDPDGAYQYRVRVVLKESLPAEPFALIIGDAFYSLRSCLDNFAFVLNGGTAAAQQMANKSEFPIFGNENRAGDPVDGAIVHKQPIRAKICGMTQAAQAAIKSLQPYMRGNRYRDDPLWILHSLCNIDKHRSVHLVASFMGGLVLKFPGLHRFKTYGGPLKDETVEPIPKPLSSWRV